MEVLPAVLPFMLISGLIMSMINYDNLPGTSAFILAIILGLSCGFPSGSHVIASLRNRNLLSGKCCQIILPLCNNVSPFFLYSYIYGKYLSNYMTFVELVFILYFPQIVFTAVLLILGIIRNKFNKNMATANSKSKQYLYAAATDNSESKQYSYAAATDNSESKQYSYAAATVTTSPSIIETSVRSITSVGVYMVIFSILIEFTKLLNPVTQTLVSPFFEISSGIKTLYLSALDIKTKLALIVCLTSFGGLCSIFQSYDVIKEARLSFPKYVLGKLFCSVICCIMFLIQ
jgi:hypothetical protein